MPCQAWGELDVVKGALYVGQPEPARPGLCLSVDSEAPYITLHFFFLSGGTM